MKRYFWRRLTARCAGDWLIGGRTKGGREMKLKDGKERKKNDEGEGDWGRCKGTKSDYITGWREMNWKKEGKKRWAITTIKKTSTKTVSIDSRTLTLTSGKDLGGENGKEERNEKDKMELYEREESSPPKGKNRGSTKRRTDRLFTPYLHLFHLCLLSVFVLCCLTCMCALSSWVGQREEWKTKESQVTPSQPTNRRE